MRNCLFALLAGCLCASLGQAQLPPEKALASFTVTDPELELSLWASEPLFVNPTCFDIDHKNRVWVCESVNYRTQLRKTKLNRPEGDRIVVLEDTDGDGKADKQTTFYQAPDFLAPLGVAVAPNLDGKGCKVYVCHSPHIYLFEDADGDLKADGPPKKLLTGFNGYDHDHGVHGILIGPDNKLYFSVGDTGVKGLVDKNGKTWNTNSTDCRAATVWRCDLDGKNLELLAHNFRNNYEPAVDSFGTVFISDNDDDGNQQTRICYVMPGGNYGYHPRGPGQTHWHEEQPGVVPKILRTGFGSPCGMCIYEGTLLPKKYWGQPLHVDAGPRHVRCYHTKPNGAGYDVEQNNIVTSTDNWFRPSDVCVAPDGSVYIADWYDPGVGGHGMGDIKMGRIYRLAPKGNKPSVPKINLESEEGLLAALGSPNLAVRSMAMTTIKGIPHEKALVILSHGTSQDNENTFLRARTLWQYFQHGGGKTIGGDGFLTGSFAGEENVSFRILAFRLQKDMLGESPADFIATTKKLLSKDPSPAVRRIALLGLTTVEAGKDPSAAVRRESLLALRDVAPERAKPLILALAKQHDGKDRFYLEAIGIAVGHHDQKRREVILADFEKHFPEWNDTVADLVWELRPPSVLPLMEKRLADKAIPAEQKLRIVDIVAASDDDRAGKVLLASLRTEAPKTVRDRTVENLKTALAGKWRKLRDDAELTNTIAALLKQAETREAALALIAAAEKLDAADQVAEIAAGKENAALRTSAIQTLGVLKSDKATKALEGLLVSADPVLQSESAKSLGKQATPGALKALQEMVADEKRPAPLRLAAIEGLAGSRNGTAWLLDANDKKQLPEALKLEVARLLRNTPYQDLRNKALIAFPPPGRIDPKKIPAIASLMQRKGDAGKGKQVMAKNKDLRCLDCHMIRGVGGAVGPDLSVIGKKASRDNLFESILLPNKAVADQFINWNIETRAGLAVTGLIVEETPEHIILRDALAKDTRILKKDIESRAKNANSIMPSDLLVYMTEDELVDIVDYLFTLKTPALGMDYWHIIGPFDNGAGDAGLDEVFPPEKSIDLKASYAGKTSKLTWKQVKPDVKGYVDLQAYFSGQSDQIVSYVYREFESPVDQEAVVFLGTDDGCKLWINGKLVHTNREHRAAIPEQDSVKVPLTKGKNTVLLKVNNGDGAHGFFFTIQAEQDLKRLEAK